MLRTVLHLLAFAVVARALVFGGNGDDLKHVIDQGFLFFDRNSDGFIDHAEFSTFVHDEDADHDGFVTLAEYMGYFNITREIAEPIFNVADPDGDGRIPDNTMEYGVDAMDANGDGKVSLKEYEHWQNGFLRCVFDEHGGHGHGTDCTQSHHHG